MDQILRQHMVSSSTICSPEYWVHHMGRDKALSATLQLQHDAGLILSNVQVLQQFVMALNWTSSDVLQAVHGRRPFSVICRSYMSPCRSCQSWHSNGHDNGS